MIEQFKLSLTLAKEQMDWMDNMVIVKIELHSAKDHSVTELGRMHISNIGGTELRGDYQAEIFRRGTSHIQRTSIVKDYDRKFLTVWKLVLRALKAAYPEEK